MRLLRILAVSFVAFAFAMSAAAQLRSNTTSPAASNNPNDNKRYTLSGTVVNSVTGEPIRRALVTLSVMQQLTAMTDSSGRFEFEDLPQTGASVTAQKPGYFNDEMLSGGRRPPPPIGVGPDAPAVVVKLVPEAVLSGRVVDADGLPIRGLMVRALTQKLMQGRRDWQPSGTARTDGDGAYRISDLMPGSYFVIAGPGRNQAFISGAEDTSGNGYPAMTYPSGTTPMRLTAGQQVETNFTVKPERFYSLSGSVSGIIPGWRYTVQLIPRMLGISTSAMRMPAGGGSADPESGVFELPHVAAGEYLLQARGFNVKQPNQDGSPNSSFGSVPISIHADTMGVTVPVEIGQAIPVNVRVERTRENRAPAEMKGRGFFAVQVRLTSVENSNQMAFSQPENPKDVSSPLLMRSVVPGKYRVEFMVTSGDTYVASARLGTTDLLNGEVTITRGEQGAIDVVVRDDSAKLDIKVHSDGPLPGASALVVPDRGSPTVIEGLGGGAGDSSTQMGGLRPGGYTVLAFESIGNLEYMNREALEPYLSHGSRVTLTPNQMATVTPAIIKAGDE